MKFTWRIKNFSTLNTGKLYSQRFLVDGCEWRMLIFPKGNNVECLSLYLDVPDFWTLPSGWRRNVQFSLAVVDQISNKCSVKKDTQHQFNARESDWGYTSFMSLNELYDPSRGYLVNDVIVVEAEIRLKKEQEEEGLYIIVKVARDEDLAKQIGRVIYFDLVDHDKVRSFRIKKQTPFIIFKEEVAKEFGIPVQFQRFWFWDKRENHTYRPDRPLTPQEESQPVGQLREVSHKKNNAELKLFLEVEFGPDLCPIPPPDKAKEDILLFFKLFEPEKQELRFVGRLFVKSYSEPIEILAKLNQLAGFAPDKELELYEEIKFEPCIMCKPVDKRISFQLSQITDGAIIIFQKSIELESKEELKCSDVPSFLEYIRLKKGQEEEVKRRYKAEPHLYTIIKVARDEDLAKQIRRNYFDLVNLDEVRSFPIKKEAPFRLFKEEVAKEFGIPVKLQRFWYWAERLNHTNRPDRPLTPIEESQSVGQLMGANKKTNPEVKLFLDVHFGPDLRPIPPPDKTKEDILLFFKLFEPEKQELRFVGRFFVKSYSEPIEILEKLNQLAGFAPDEEIKLYEEIKFEPRIMCVPVDKRISFQSSQIIDGDIICFQKFTQVESEQGSKYSDVPSFLEYIRLKKGQEEEVKRRYTTQPHLYTIVKVARDEDLVEQIGQGIHFDLVDHDKVRSFPITKQTPFSLFKEEVAREFGIPVQLQRFWIWAKRENQTYRPHRPLTPQEESQSVGQLMGPNKENNPDLKLFLEVQFGPDLRPIPLPDKTNEDILLFFKLFEPEKQKLRFVGRLFVKSSSEPIEIIAKLNQLAGFAPDEEIELYAEITFEPCIICEQLDKRISFRLSEIIDGDVICFQKSTPLESEQGSKFFYVPSFLKYVRNRQAAQVTSESLTTNVGNETANEEIETQTDAPKVTMGSLAGPSSNDDLTLRRLSAAEELLKSSSVGDLIGPKCPAAEALAALETVRLYANSSLASLCTEGAYDEFTVALKLLQLTEQGIISLRITSLLKDVLEPLECEIPKYAAAEKELAQGQEFRAQHEEIKARMELAMQKCQNTKDIVANYDAKVAELEAQLTRFKAIRAEAMGDLKTAVDEMEPFKQSFADSSSKWKSFTVREAMLTVQKGASLGTWNVVKDVLKDHFKL